MGVGTKFLQLSAYGGAFLVARAVNAARLARVNIGNLAHLGFRIRLQALEVFRARIAPKALLQLPNRHNRELHASSLSIYHFAISLYFTLFPTQFCPLARKSSVPREVGCLQVVTGLLTFMPQFHSVTPLICSGSKETGQAGASGESHMWVPKGQDERRPQGRAA